ncbi:MAG: bacteriohemerythrin [Nitrospirae bacterium]|nr:MAG: bacteriohemerythrin [Nitrospirota bacterium]
MALMEWSERLSVNLKEVDEQHKKLLALVNELHDAMKSGKGNEAIGKTLDSLMAYVKTHFDFEEKMMTKYAYPDYPAHKREHENLTTKAVDLQTQFRSGKPVLSLEVMSFLQNWLTNHIMNTDKKYSPFLKGKGVS